MNDLVKVEELDGALGLFVQYILETAKVPQPWLAVGASLAALGTIMGRKYASETDLRSNVYVVSIADSGEGKDNARKAIKQAFADAGLEHHLGGDKLASGSGLLTALQRNTSMLFQHDEFGAFLCALAAYNAPGYVKTIWDLLTQLYTTSNSIFLGTEYADQQKNPRLTIIEPCVCLHATTVPGKFWQALASGSLEDGSLARFLMFDVGDDIPDEVDGPRKITDVPEPLIKALQSIAWGARPQTHTGNLQHINGASIAPMLYVVPSAPKAKEALADLGQRLLDERRECKKTGQAGRAAVLARIRENTIKIALIKAVSACPEEPIIHANDLEWAKRVADRCAAALLTKAELHMAENLTEANTKRVFRIILAAGERGVSLEVLGQRTRDLKPRERQEILTNLMASGDIKMGIRYGTGGRPSQVYFDSRLPVPEDLVCTM